MIAKERLFWDYRIIKKVVDGEETYGIYEVFYDENDKPFICTEKPCSPYGDSPAELAEDMKWMQEAFDMPILNYEIFDM
jgi:hypothetical protein